MFRMILPRLSACLFILFFASVLAGGPQLLNTDGDLPRHLLMGKYVLEQASPPMSEIFSYPYAGREYVPHEWLAGVVFYLAYLIFNLNGVVLLAGILIGSTFMLVYKRAVTNNDEKLFSFLLVLLGGVVTSIHWVARPHLFTMLFLAIWLIWLDRLNREGRVSLRAFPILMAFWANTHAESIVGFLALLAHLAGSVWLYVSFKEEQTVAKIKTLLGISLLGFAASLVNPFGLKAWTTVIGYINNEYLMSRISETRPPDFLETESIPLLILLSLSVLLVALRRENFKPTDMFLLAGFGLLSLVSARNAHLFGVAAPLVLSHSLKGIRAPRALINVGLMFARLESRARGAIIPILSTILIGAFLLANPLRGYNRFDPAVFPIRAVQWLETHPQKGRMFNAFDWGGYILLHLWPAHQVFIESQTDTNGELTRLYEAVVTLSPGREDVFSMYGIEWAIIPPDWGLTEALKREGWMVAYEDATAVVLVDK